MSATMDKTQPLTSPEPPSDDPERIRADILATRERLGATVEALTAKVDVRARFANARHRAIGSARSGADTVRDRWVPLAIAAGAVLAIVAGGLIVNRQRTRRCGS